MLEAPRKMTNNKCKSFNVSITLTCLHKLVKFHNLVDEGHKHNLLLAIWNTMFARASTLNVNKRVEWTAKQSLYYRTLDSKVSPRR